MPLVRAEKSGPVLRGPGPTRLASRPDRTHHPDCQDGGHPVHLSTTRSASCARSPSGRTPRLHPPTVPSAAPATRAITCTHLRADPTRLVPSAVGSRLPDTPARIADRVRPAPPTNLRPAAPG